MIFTSNKFEDAMDAFMNYCQTLLPFAVQSELNEQVRDYEANIKRIMDASGEDRDAVIAITGEFAPDKNEAERNAKMSIDIGIGNRLRGAIACHKAGHEAECARLLVFAQAEVFGIMGMKDGYHALSSAAGFMFEQNKESVTA